MQRKKAQNPSELDRNLPYELFGENTQSEFDETLPPELVNNLLEQGFFTELTSNQLSNGNTLQSIESVEQIPDFLKCDDLPQALIEQNNQKQIKIHLDKQLANSLVRLLSNGGGIWRRFLNHYQISNEMEGRIDRRELLITPCPGMDFNKSNNSDALLQTITNYYSFQSVRIEIAALDSALFTEYKKPSAPLESQTTNKRKHLENDTEEAYFVGEFKPNQPNNYYTFCKGLQKTLFSSLSVQLVIENDVEFSVYGRNCEKFDRDVEKLIRDAAIKSNVEIKSFAEKKKKRTHTNFVADALGLFGTEGQRTPTAEELKEKLNILCTERNLRRQ